MKGALLQFTNLPRYGNLCREMIMVGSSIQPLHLHLWSFCNLSICAYQKPDKPDGLMMKKCRRGELPVVSVKRNREWMELRFGRNITFFFYVKLDGTVAKRSDFKGSI